MFNQITKCKIVFKAIKNYKEYQYPQPHSPWWCIAKYVVIISALLGFIARAGAEEPSGTRQLVQQAFSSMQSALDQCKTIEFQTLHQVTETDIYHQIHLQPLKAGQGRTAEIHFQASGEKYLYTRVLTEYDGSGVRSYDRAYDGKYYQVLDHHLGSLLITKADPDRNHLHLVYFNPLNMFGFLESQVPGNDPTLTWSSVKNAKFWSGCLAGAQFVGSEIHANKPCVVARIPGGIHKEFKVPCTYIVYFSVKDGFFPIAWKATDQNGRLLQNYEVNEFGKVAVCTDGSVSFYYPKKATNITYTEDSKYPAGMPQGTITTETKLMRVNTISDDTIFTIDPAMASEVVDADQNVAVPVPK